MKNFKDSRVNTNGFDRVVVKVHGIEQVLYTAGRGPALFYFHGASTFHGFDFARDWLNDFRVFVPYHPGFGESSDAVHLTSTQDYAIHYRALLDELGLDVIHLVGCSLGGRLAAEFALNYPDRVASLTLLCPAGMNCPQTPMADLGSIPPQELPGYLVHNTRVLEPFLPTAEDPAFNAIRARESVTISRITQPGFISPLINSTTDNLKPETLLLWGENDRVIPLEQAAVWKRKFPNIQIETLKSVGHLILDESKNSRQRVASFCKKVNAN